MQDTSFFQTFTNKLLTIIFKTICKLLTGKKNGIVNYFYFLNFIETYGKRILNF